MVAGCYLKDDHGLTNQSFSPFKDRVLRCANAVQEANAKSGHHTIYAANVSGDGTDVLDRAHYAKEAGATALMVAPSLIGLVGSIDWPRMILYTCH